MRNWDYLKDLAERLRILNLRKITGLVKPEDPIQLEKIADDFENMHYELLEED